MVAKNDSATALSQHSPLRPTERTTPLVRANSVKSPLVYWADSSGRRNTSMMEVSRDGSWQATEGDVGDARKDVLAGTAARLAAGPGAAVLGRDRQGAVERGGGAVGRGGIRRWQQVVP